MRNWQASVVAGGVRLVCGVRSLEDERFPPGPKVFYANHTSHLDFMVIWSVLPADERRLACPVAGRDYWEKGRLRRYLAAECFHALLIERKRISRENNPLVPMVAALEAGYSLIVFPEGTRRDDLLPGSFRPGLFHLHQKVPDVPLVPVYLQNLNRMLPKGAFLPIPLITYIHFGNPLSSPPGERKAFLDYTRNALIELNSK